MRVLHLKYLKFKQKDIEKKEVLNKVKNIIELGYHSSRKIRKDAVWLVGIKIWVTNFYDLTLEQKML